MVQCGLTCPDNGAVFLMQLLDEKGIVRISDDVGMVQVGESGPERSGKYAQRVEEQAVGRNARVQSSEVGSCEEGGSDNAV